MLDLVNTHKCSFFQYSFRIVSCVVTQEQMPLKDKLYVKDDAVKLPLWLAKLRFRENFLIIEEFENMNNTINKLILQQKLSKNKLIPIELDFYMLVNDYFTFYTNFKLKYLELDDTISENEKYKTIMTLKDQIEVKKNQVQTFVDTRKRIILLNAYQGFNKDLKHDMSFEEYLIYSNICDNLKSYDNFFSYVDNGNI